MAAETLDILVVDDESDLREQIKRRFERDGHRVVAVADGRAAVDRATTGQFDIVLLDISLGAGPDGYEVCRTRRERRNVVPIVMLTALGSEADGTTPAKPELLLTVRGGRALRLVLQGAGAEMEDESARLIDRAPYRALPLWSLPAPRGAPR